MSYLFPISSTTELGVVQVGTGINVSDGVISIQNIQGIQGRQGIQGTQGIQGVQGRQGVQGTQGIQGIQGTQSNQGIQGIQGTGSGGSTIGTWTPTVTSSAAATITVVATTANYSKIGQQVICYFDITVTVESGGSSTGAVSLSGLPFTSVASLGYVGSVIVSYFANTAARETAITGSVIGNSTRASLWNAHEVYDISSFTQDDIQVTTRLQGTVIYLSAS